MHSVKCRPRTSERGIATRKFVGKLSKRNKSPVKKICASVLLGIGCTVELPQEVSTERLVQCWKHLRWTDGTGYHHWQYLNYHCFKWRSRFPQKPCLPETAFRFSMPSSKIVAFRKRKRRQNPFMRQQKKKFAKESIQLCVSSLVNTSAHSMLKSRHQWKEENILRYRRSRIRKKILKLARSIPTATPISNASFVAKSCPTFTFTAMDAKGFYPKTSTYVAIAILQKSLWLLFKCILQRKRSTQLYNIQVRLRYTIVPLLSVFSIDPTHVSSKCTRFAWHMFQQVIQSLTASVDVLAKTAHNANIVVTVWGAHVAATRILRSAPDCATLPTKQSCCRQWKTRQT